MNKTQYAVKGPNARNWEYLELRDLPKEGGFGLFCEDGSMYLRDAGAIFKSQAEAEQYLIDNDLRASIR